jgi:hypothetical protein
MSYASRVRETTTVTGTGDATLLGAAATYVTFTSLYSDGKWVPYIIQGGQQFEEGIAPISGTNLLQRSLGRVLASSSGGTPVNFAAGTKTVDGYIGSTDVAIRLAVEAITSVGGGGGGGDASAANQVIANTRVGDITETVPANDTASSGLNGRLQRIAQRLTSLIALLPASLGIKTAANSLSVAPASDALHVVAFQSAATTSISGTIAAGGTAQNAAAANSSRRGFWIQNNSAGDLWISTVATAVASQPSLKIASGALYESPPGGAGTGAISIIGATTSQAFSGREW